MRASRFIHPQATCSKKRQILQGNTKPHTAGIFMQPQRLLACGTNMSIRGKAGRSYFYTTKTTEPRSFCGEKEICTAAADRSLAQKSFRLKGSNTLCRCYAVRIHAFRARYGDRPATRRLPSRRQREAVSVSPRSLLSAGRIVGISLSSPPPQGPLEKVQSEPHAKNQSHLLPQQQQQPPPSPPLRLRPSTFPETKAPEETRQSFENKHMCETIDKRERAEGSRGLFFPCTPAQSCVLDTSFLRVEVRKHIKTSHPAHAAVAPPKVHTTFRDGPREVARSICNSTAVACRAAATLLSPSCCNNNNVASLLRWPRVSLSLALFTTRF